MADLQQYEIGKKCKKHPLAALKKDFKKKKYRYVCSACYKEKNAANKGKVGA